VITEFTWDEDGNRVEVTTPIRPYLYYEDKVNGSKSDLSMFGNPLTKL